MPDPDGEAGVDENVRPDFNANVRPRRATVAMYLCLATALCFGLGSVWVAAVTGYLKGTTLVPGNFVSAVAHHYLALPAAWLCLAAGVVAACAAIGYSSNSGPFAVLINAQDRFSLSRFQMLLWSIIIIPAFLIATVFKSTGLLSTGGAATLSAAAIRPELWLLLGGALTAPAATAFVLNRAADSKPLARRQGKGNARFSDFFYGEQEENAGEIDLSRVQHFFVSTILGFLYGSYLLAWFLKTGSTPATTLAALELPAFDSTLLGILAASHATYLNRKT